MTTHRLILHQHPFASFCWKPLIALYELDLPFESVIVDGDAARDALTELWPLGSIPVLRDETVGLTLPESSSIVEYLDGLAPGATLLPGDGLQARLWDRIVDDFVARPMQTIVFDSLREPGDHDRTGVQRARATLDTAYAHLDGHAADHPWLAGDTFTLADCAAAPALFYARIVHPWDEPRHGALTRLYRDLMHRASVERVVDAARPYRDVFPLPWPGDADAHQRARQPASTSSTRSTSASSL